MERVKPRRMAFIAKIITLRNMLLKKILSKDNSKVHENNIRETHKTSLINAGLILKEKRESYGFSRAELSYKTRISVTVIEAIENGWSNNLPEPAYLIPMLKIIENELKLEKNILKVISSRSSEPLSPNINTAPNAIYNDFLQKLSYKVLYIICILTSILLLNRYQIILSQKNSNTISPILTNNSNQFKQLESKD
ncbi:MULTISPECIES: helix-turn-helix domain-containing protein [unclassified Prochlorococcus]|uniref:helix-turn-helix domain-containing protein n=1 Tax=unclassified Prochlorococcus TaxID=2627481 RepID=UPI0009DF4926|nr:MULTISPECIES: helix-turn-helix domain-containing protein [unclassified Prochlorococcus]